MEGIGWRSFELKANGFGSVESEGSVMEEEKREKLVSEWFKGERRRGRQQKNNNQNKRWRKQISAQRQERAPEK